MIKVYVEINDSSKGRPSEPLYFARVNASSIEEAEAAVEELVKRLSGENPGEEPVCESV